MVYRLYKSPFGSRGGRQDNVRLEVGCIVGMGARVLADISDGATFFKRLSGGAAS